MNRHFQNSARKKVFFADSTITDEATTPFGNGAANKKHPEK